MFCEQSKKLPLNGNFSYPTFPTTAPQVGNVGRHNPTSPTHLFRGVGCVGLIRVGFERTVKKSPIGEMSMNGKNFAYSAGTGATQ